MMSGDAPREAHALSFRVARLSKPSLALETGVKLDLTVDMGEAVAIPVEKMGQMVPVRAFEGRTQSEEAAATFGVDGSLCLANSRQAIYLGEGRRFRAM
ncbi:unnamed protein product [Ostreobium quekettii]|uniref:Uncharacterized protein n=1 Tax=Ostreobium quekettii TaxID=121088 RepID=A0A8S1J130_9CHLO|nr:unnamed protein product [Ostreobium quekettii]